MKDGELAGLVKHFLETRKIKEYEDLKDDEKEEGKPLVPLFSAEGTCYRTEALEKMALQGEHETYRNIMELLEEGTQPFNQDLVSIMQLQEVLKEKGQGSRSNEIKTALEKLGGDKIGKARHTASGRTPTLYAMENQSHYKTKLTASDCVNSYWLPLAYAGWNIEEHKATKILENQKNVGREIPTSKFKNKKAHFEIKIKKEKYK